MSLALSLFCWRSGKEGLETPLVEPGGAWFGWWRQAERAGVRMEARRAETQTRFTTAAPEGHAPTTSYVENQMGMTDDDDTVYCDVQMPLAQGRELLQLVCTLRESNAHPALNRVFERMQYELSTSIDIIENPPTWGPWCQ